MDKEIARLNIGSVIRQRNLFLILSMAMSLSSVLLSIKLVTNDVRTILVPGLSQTVWIEGRGVSKGYLEEASIMYLPYLLDLNPEIIQHKAKEIFKHVSQSSPIYMKSLQEYFASSREKYKQFNLSTYFSVKNLAINESELSVICNGVLTSIYGDRGFQTQEASYKLSFEWIGGKLKLKEFVRILSDQELKAIEEEKKLKEKAELDARGELKKIEKSIEGQQSEGR